MEERERSFEELERDWRAAEGAGSPDERFEALIPLFHGCLRAGKMERADALSVAAMALVAEMLELRDDPQLRLFEHASECKAAGDWAGAEAAYRKALAVAQQPVDRIQPHRKLMALYLLLGTTAEALEEARLETVAAREYAMDLLTSEGLAHQAECLLGLGHAAEAVSLATEASTVAPAEGQIVLAPALILRARGRVCCGTLAEAEEDLATAWVILQPMADMGFAAGVQSRLAEWWSATAELRAARGDRPGAAEARREAIERYEHVNRVPWASAHGQLAIALRDLAASLIETASPAQAATALALSDLLRAERRLP